MNIDQQLKEVLEQFRLQSWDKARNLCQSILMEDSKNVFALHFMGLIEFNEKHHKKALAYLNQAIEKDPKNPLFYRNRSLVYLQLEEFMDAIKDCQTAIQIKPDYLDAYVSLGNAFIMHADYKKAVEAYKMAQKLKPNDTNIWHRLGNAHLFNQDAKNAITCYEEILKADPTKKIAILINLGVAYTNNRAFEKALKIYKDALEIDPKNPQIYCNIASTYYGMLKLDEAIEACEQAIKLNPNSCEAYANLGVTYRIKTEYNKAIEYSQKALSLNPNFSNAKFNIALCQLIQGDYEHGWEYYSERPSIIARRPTIPHYVKTLWRGESLKNKVIYLYSEQGVGDTLQFMRFIPLIKKMGAYIVFECQPELIPLLENQLAVDQFIPRHSKIPHFDYHYSISDFPAVLKTTLNNIPYTEGYVKAPKNSLLGKNLEKTSSLRVGIAWAGNRAHLEDNIRSMLLEKFAPLLTLEGVNFYSFQVGEHAKDINALTGSKKLIDLSSKINNFKDTASLVEHMDLIITVDTALAHLAAAMGKPTWILLGYSCDFRWLRDREDSPWYESVHLFRQSQLGNWESVISQVAKKLKLLVKNA